MRQAILGTLLLAPAMLHAQATAPAQPSSTVQAMLESAPATGAASTSTIRVSTGVHEAKLIHSVAIQSGTSAVAVDRSADIAFTIDEKGTPTNLRVVHSAGDSVDQNILYAVSQYRYSPATLDDQPVAVEANLHIVLHDAAQ